MKPGEKCGCRTLHETHMLDHIEGVCTRDADRLVNVVVQAKGGQITGPHIHYVPMCEPCAQFHESHSSIETGGERSNEK